LSLQDFLQFSDGGWTYQCSICCFSATPFEFFSYVELFTVAGTVMATALQSFLTETKKMKQSKNKIEEDGLKNSGSPRKYGRRNVHEKNGKGKQGNGITQF
jgi:hypothetical protein